MRKKNYKGVKCTKKYVEKCEGVCKTFDNIQYAYLKEHLPSYKVVDIREKSAYPEDSHLYMVSAQKDDGTFAVWTCWNQETKSLNHGHYNLPHHDDCVEIFEEYYTPKEE